MCHLPAADSDKSAGAPADKIEVTAEMTRAGGLEFSSFDERFEDVADAVVRIYRAMERTRLTVPAVRRDG